MATGPLVERLSAAGRRLLELLDAAQIDIRSALWLYRPESDDWVLVLALPDVDTSGPRVGYERVQSVFAINRKDLEPLSLEDVTVTGLREPLIQLLRAVLDTGPGIQELRFTKNQINGFFIEDALIYRVN